MTEGQTSGTAVSEWLDLPDALLLRQCVIENARGSGPGGQHRNKVETGVRIRHLPTGCTGQAFERRSRQQNLATATTRLRQDIALRVRRPADAEGYQPPPALAAILPAASGGRPGPGNPRFWAGVQHLLDLFVACGCSVADTAAVLGLSTGALSRVIARSPEVLAEANRLRAGRGLPPLRP
jgi:hypothetical protein